MLKITVKVDGMMCGMCESHINDAVRHAFSVIKVTSSHGKGETVIISEEDIDEAALRAAIDATGYEVKSVSIVPYEKRVCSILEDDKMKGMFAIGKGIDYGKSQHNRCAGDNAADSLCKGSLFTAAGTQIL